jgi:arsenate reductase-like glutaredoxin family protein
VISPHRASRRVFQRRLHRRKRKEKKSLSNQIIQQNDSIKQRCLQRFGVCANPLLSLQKNFNNNLKATTTSPTSQQPTNLSFHNLCTKNKLPLGTRQLLGLNLNFCLATNKLQDYTKGTLLKMAYSIRTKYYLKENGLNTDNNYIKQIYKKNKNWNPPPASSTIEDKLTQFEKSLKELQNTLTRKYKNTNLSNLTSIQAQALQAIKNNKELIIKPSDKNLGPTLMDLETYILQVLQEHLLTKDYIQLSEREALNRMENLKLHLKNIIKEHHNSLPKTETTYFERSLKAHFRLPIFYGLPKVHKTPMSLRPVVSSTNSLLATFSIWLDYKMKDLLPLTSSYLKDSYTLIQELKDLQLPETAKLFTADAKSMYTNIDTATGLTTMTDFLAANQDKLPTGFPSTLFLQILEIVMRNNVFSFADTYWLQLSGTAMGTPAACAYATLTYGHFENTTLLPTFKENLLYYRRYIDDVFGIWIPPPLNKANTWNHFKTTLNGWGKLEWSLQELSQQCQFLDLNITILNSRLNFATFQKPLNLYLYIPPLSAHPQSCFKGLIKGELNRFWRQNSPYNFQELTTKFLERLHARGHSLEKLRPLFTEAASTLDNPQNLRANTASDNTLFVHWTHHPKGIQRNNIRQIYNLTLQPHDIHDNMIVAMSRPKNLRDSLTRAKLSLPNDTTVQSFITKLTNN